MEEGEEEEGKDSAGRDKKEKERREVGEKLRSQAGKKRELPGRRRRV